MSALRRERPAPPVRHVHLGLGNFFRAHQAWYTTHASDGEEWGIAAFSGRSAGLAEQLATQDGLYTLDTRAADGDHVEIIPAVVAAHAADDDAAWLGYFEDPAVVLVTSTVTEAGYLRGADGHLDTAHPDVTADLAALRTDPRAAGRTAPVRLVAGLLARRAARAGAITFVPCDNLQGNGAVIRTVVRDAAALLDPSLLEWIDEHVSFVTTMVDRITPRPTAEDVALVREATGREDPVPVVTEPFTEWVLEGAFPAGRPRWEDAGATFTDDIEPFETRKLYLLNGAHSLLAYAGPLRGHETVAEAVADPTCRTWVEAWWDEAVTHLVLPATDLVAYRAALLERFENPAIRHLLAQIAVDGSKKLRERVVPILRAERAAGRSGEAATRIIAAWVAHLRAGGPVEDVLGEQLSTLAAGELELAAARVLDALGPGLDEAEAAAVAVQVATQVRDLAGEVAP